MQKRKANIDLLKILAMLGIILFHHFGNRIPNQFVQLTEGFTAETYFYDFINNVPGGVSKVSLIMDFCYGHFGDGGNFIFMLITGYFLFGREISFPKRIRTISNVLYAIFFHGVVLTIINIILSRLFTLPNWLSGENLWYLQAYGIFILCVLPLLKLFEDKLTQKTHLCLALSLIFINFLAYSKYLPNIWLSFRLVEFIMCYYIGGYFSKYRLRISTKKLLIFSAIYLVSYFLYEYYWRYFNAKQYEPSQYSYISVMQPFICCIIFALLCFSFFNNMNIPSSKILSNISSTTIGIYIFHFNFIGISVSIANKYWWHDWSRNGYFLFAIIDSVLLFVIGFLIDSVRLWSYKKIRDKSKKLILKD